MSDEREGLKMDIPDLVIRLERAGKHLHPYAHMHKQAAAALEALAMELQQARSDARELDAVLDDEGVAVSCINRKEDLTRAIRALKTRAEAAERAIAELPEKLWTAFLSECERCYGTPPRNFLGSVQKHKELYDNASRALSEPTQTEGL